MSPVKTGVSLNRTTTETSARRHPIFVRVFCVAIAVGAGLAIAETGLRLMGVGLPAIYTPDHHCGSRLRPSTTGVWNTEGFGEISINSLGFRGPELVVPKPGNTFRIAVLGDSFIEALSVNDEQSFCRQLEQRLSERSDLPIANSRIEVVNCGVSGYGTAQELQMLKSHVLPLSPDAVLIFVFPENDIRNNLRSLEGDAARPYFLIDDDENLVLDVSFRTSSPYITASSRYEQLKATFVNRSRILQLLQQARQKSGQTRAVPERNNSEDILLRDIDEALYVYKESADPAHVSAWAVTERLLLEIRNLCRSHDIPLYVLTVSTPAQVYPDVMLRQRLLRKFDIPDLFHAEHRIGRFCDDSEIEFFPLASELSHLVDQSGEFLHGFPNTRLGLGHWNSTGHAHAARVTAEWLTSLPGFTEH